MVFPSILPSPAVRSLSLVRLPSGSRWHVLLGVGLPGPTSPARRAAALFPEVDHVPLAVHDEALAQQFGCRTQTATDGSSDSDELVTAIREVAGGRLMIPDAAVRRAFRLIRRGGQLTPGPKVLTARERETLALFAKGKSYEQIAEIRGIGMTTVRNAVYRIQDKLGVKTKQEIVVWAVRNGLLDEEEGIDSQQTP